MAAIDQVKGAFKSIKAFWTNLPKKTKIIILSGSVALIIAAITITSMMYAKSSQYQVLFSEITTAEASEVYSVLQEQGVQAKMSGAGKVMVPKEQVENLIFQMAAKGYPKTAPPYGTFLDNVGPTTTEYEKRKIYNFMVQDRVQTTLNALDEVKSSIVTVAQPEQSGLVLDDTTTEPTAAVMLTLEKGVAISPETVSTIKKLTAAAVGEGCKAENVIVTDAATSIELESDDALNVAYSLKQFDYEHKLAKRAEDAVKTLYSTVYGVDGIKVSASYEVDTDKMKQESKEFKPNETTGNGVKTQDEEHYTSNGKLPVQGVAGEENNADPPLPGYVAEDGATTDNIQSFDRINKYETSYILTQLERGAAPIKRSSITALVNDKNLTAVTQDEISAQISKATGIATTDVVVGSLNIPSPDTVGPQKPPVPFYQNTIFLMAMGGAVLVLCMMLIAFPILLSRRKKKKKAAADAALAAEKKLAEESAQRAQAEVDMHKNKLKFEAEAQKIQDGSMTEEIRSFAKENPEMTATLIRSLLKEDT